MFAFTFERMRMNKSECESRERSFSVLPPPSHPPLPPHSSEWSCSTAARCPLCGNLVRQMCLECLMTPLIYCDLTAFPLGHHPQGVQFVWRRLFGKQGGRSLDVSVGEPKPTEHPPPPPPSSPLPSAHLIQIKAR